MEWLFWNSFIFHFSRHISRGNSGISNSGASRADRFLLLRLPSFRSFFKEILVERLYDTIAYSLLLLLLFVASREQFYFCVSICKLSERLEIKNKIVLTEMNFHENFNFYFFLMSFAILFQMFVNTCHERENNM